MGNDVIPVSEAKCPAFAAAFSAVTAVRAALSQGLSTGYADYGACVLRVHGKPAQGSRNGKIYRKAAGVKEVKEAGK
jgi:hypothetical protein